MRGSTSWCSSSQLVEGLQRPAQVLCSQRLASTFLALDSMADTVDVQYQPVDQGWKICPLSRLVQHKLFLGLMCEKEVFVVSTGLAQSSFFCSIFPLVASDGG